MNLNITITIIIIIIITSSYITPFSSPIKPISDKYYRIITTAYITTIIIIIIIATISCKHINITILTHMTDLTQFFNFSRPTNGSYSQQALAHNSQQQAPFDINEFPSLSKMNLLSQMQASNRANYVNIAKDNQSTSVDSAQSEFTISSEDFPALPGSLPSSSGIIGTKSQTTGPGQQQLGGSSSSTKQQPSPTKSSSTSITNHVGNSMMPPSSTSPFSQSAAASIASPQHQGLMCVPGTPPSGGGSTSGNAITLNSILLNHSAATGPGIIGSKSWAGLNQGSVAGAPTVVSPPSNAFSNIQGPGNSSMAHHLHQQSRQHQQSPSVSGTSRGLSTSALINLTSTTTAVGNATATTAGSMLLNNNNTAAQSMISGNNQVKLQQTSSASPSSMTNLPQNTSAPKSAPNDNANTPINNNNKGVQISNDGRVTNIPSSMVTDQFGMIGLLAFLRAAETDPNLASVTFGTDLTALGLNLTAQEKLYPSFAGPWWDRPLKVYEIDYPVPSEYLVNSIIREKLAQIQLKRYHEDTIFFLFYMFPNDVLQMAAAAELYSREWRYHKEEKVWITRAPGMPIIEKTQTYERGTYYFFDPHNWRRVPKEFYLEYDRLESKPNLPN